MNIKEMFPNINAMWVRWSDYKIVESNGIRYLLPTDDATIMIYNPLDCGTELITDALNMGQSIQDNQSDTNFVDKQCIAFARKYGLLGWMTCLPQDTDFDLEDQVYLGKNGELMDGKVMNHENYLSYFYPIKKKDSAPIAFSMGREEVFDFVFNQGYGEPVLWLSAVLINLYTHFFCYLNWDIDEFTADEKAVMRHRAVSFHNNGISFKLTGTGHPDMVWEIDSLNTAIETLYALAITDKTLPLKMCKHCGNAYYNSNSRSEFCSAKCRNQYNVRAFRMRNKEL